MTLWAVFQQILILIINDSSDLSKLNGFRAFNETRVYFIEAIS